jgi:septum site-determining protein MinD
MHTLAGRYDLVLIDTPAGVGGAFAAAVAACDVALLVVTPDPVCVRDASRVRLLLAQHATCGARLLINRLDSRHLALRDLDEVIDTVGAQLLGVIPEDTQVYAATCCGARLPAESRAGKAFACVAGRMLGERIPLLIE